VVQSELVRILSDKLPELQTRDVELAVNSMLEQIIVALENDERIEIRGFGSFTLRHQPVRLARNPRTGESVNFPAKIPHRAFGTLAPSDC